VIRDANGADRDRFARRQPYVIRALGTDVISSVELLRCQSAADKFTASRRGSRRRWIFAETYQRLRVQRGRAIYYKPG